MAETLVWKIQFIEDNPYGTYVAGDVVDIYYDPDLDPSPALSSTVGYSVKKNGGTITSGNDILYTTFPYKIEQNQNAAICNATTLVAPIRGITYFPYVFTYVEPDHPTCAVDPGICDLMVVGTPVIVPASASDASDGELTIVASSSNSPIEYKLGAPFIYGDGSGQSSGTFTGLLPGSYRIYMRDTLNCSAEVLVTVNFDDTYSLIYRLEYDDYPGGVSRVDIYKRAYAGASFEVCGSDTPFERQLSGEGSLNKFEPILSSKGTVNLLAEVEGQFADIFTNNPNDFRLYFYKNDVFQWIGKVLPQQGNVQYKSPPYYVSIIATDGLALLSDFPFVQDDGQRFNGSIRQIELIAYILRKTDINLNIRCACNMYAQGMFTTFDRLLSEFETDLDGWVNYLGSLNPQWAWSASYNGSAKVTTINTFGTANLRYSSITLPQQPFTIIIKYVVLNHNSDNLSLRILIEDASNNLLYNVVFTSGFTDQEQTAILQVTNSNIWLNGDHVIIAVSSTDFDAGDEIYITSIEFRGAVNDPLYQAFEDTETYYINDPDPTLDYVLRGILEPYGAKLIQENGVWNIVRTEELRAAYNYREYDSYGEYISSGVFDPIVNIDNPAVSDRLVWSDRDQNLELKPGYGKIIVYYKLGLKSNILRNGDFRLRSVYDSTTNTYSYRLDKTGFQLVTAGQSVSESYERLEGGNIAYIMNGGRGLAYLQSDTYFIRMGIDDSLRIKIRYKIPNNNKPYQKVKIRVTYGIYYLQSNGSWSTTVNELIFFATEFDKYIESEIIAFSPSTTTAVDGFDFNVRVYHSYSIDAEYTSFNSLIAVDTTTIPLETKTQIISSELNTYSIIYYYELQEDTEITANTIDSISNRGDYNPSSGDYPTSGGSGTAGAIRKGDYWRMSFGGSVSGTTVFANDKIVARVNSPGQANGNWIINVRGGRDSEFLALVRPTSFLYPSNLKDWSYKGSTFAVNQDSKFYIDYIKVEYLVNGNSPVDTIVREIKAESRNTQVLEKELIHGSYRNVITTASAFELGPNKFSIFFNVTSSLVSTSVLSADLIYAGYLRSSDGVGYELWTRNGISESDSMHGIFLKSYAAQYKRSWRKITGTLYSNDRYLTFLNTLKEVFDGNRLYIPISLTIDDLRNKYNGEFLELIDITADPGSDGSGEAPYSSGFTTGFGASGFD